MPRYYFGDDTEAPDTFGREPAGDDAARSVAAPVSEEFGRGLAARPSVILFDAEREIAAPSFWVIDSELPATRH
jgi:hypothetical protein